MQGADAAHEAFQHKTWDDVVPAALPCAQMQVSPLYWHGTLGGAVSVGKPPSTSPETAPTLLGRSPCLQNPKIRNEKPDSRLPNRHPR